MKRFVSLLSFLLLLSLACSLGGVPGMTPSLQPTAGAQNPLLATATQPQVQGEAGEAVLLFTIGMHIEPLGQTAQGFRSGGRADYRQPQFFQRQVEDILAVASIVEAHGGRMTIQAQSPFTSAAIESGSTILADLAARGHEMALHFHEDAHLGQDSDSLPVQQWCEVMKQENALIMQASGVSEIRYWSGGNLYPNVYQAAECAGLDVNSDWKNPHLQETPLELVGVNPWRPAGGTDGIDLTRFIQHDPNGAIVFLPEGQYDRSNFASMRRSEDTGGDEAYFEYLKTQLYASLAAAQPGKVNVFHFTVHPGEFRGSPQQPFAVIEKFLTEVVDPLVASGQVQWATFSEMADAYAAWQAAHPGENPRAALPSAASTVSTAASTLSSPLGGSPCGNGVCEGPENAQNCPADCSAAPAPSPAAGQNPANPDLYEHGQRHTVTNPSSGAALAAWVFYPANWDGQRQLPALVLVPGGSGDSSPFLRPGPGGSTVQVINQAGYAAVVFDSDGRGQSGGTEDYDGFIHQDGLAEVIRFAAALPGIDAAQIGLVTYSYGITMGAGALARHPDLPVKFLIDWEGPANRSDTGGCDSAGLGHLKQVASCADESFWSQREASAFIGQIRVLYQRIQSEKDHVQPDNAHALLMVNNAVTGGVPWVRLNDEPPNQTYDAANPPAMLPDSIDRQIAEWIVKYAAELFAR